MSVFDVPQQKPPHPSWSHYVDDHLHHEQQIGPLGALPVTLTAGAAWVLGAFSADILADAWGTQIFDIHWILLSNASANAVYDIILYAGAADEVCAYATIVRTGVQTNSFQGACQTKQMIAGSRIRAKLMSENAGVSIDVKIAYHVY